MHQQQNAVRQAALAAGWSHRHRDVSGGRLRPTVFGAVDGLVTNASLIAGLGGGQASPHAVILTGVAALVAGAFSMGTGEYISVTNQNELVHAEVATERTMHARFPAAEQAELAETFSRLRRRPGNRRPDGRSGLPGPRYRAARAYPGGTRRRPVRAALGGRGRRLVAGRLLRRGAHPAAAVPGGPVRAGRRPGPVRGGAARRRHGGGPGSPAARCCARACASSPWAGSPSR